MEAKQEVFDLTLQLQVHSLEIALEESEIKKKITNLLHEKIYCQNGY
jgi:hypothetical protein